MNPPGKGSLQVNTKPTIEPVLGMDQDHSGFGPDPSETVQPV